MKNFDLEVTENKVISSRHSLPENVFSKPFSYRVFFDFELVFGDEFIDGLLSFVKVSKGESFITCKDISTDEFCEKRFTLELSSSSQSQEVNAFFSKEIISGFSLSEAADRLILFSNSLSWSIYCDRDFELCIASFDSEKVYLNFLETFSKCENKFSYSVENAISSLYLLDNLPSYIKKQLAANYQAPQPPPKNS